MESFFCNLPEKLQKELEEKLSRFSDALKSSGQALPKREDQLHALQKAFLFSDFVFKYAVKNPDSLYEILEDESPRVQSVETFSNRIDSILNDVMDDREMFSAIRRFRNLEMARIAFHDLTGRADLFDTLASLSNFADACTDRVLAWLYSRFCDRYGVPGDAAGTRQCLVVMGMGKLGGRELNFSSDIDLILTHPSDGEAEINGSTISNAEFFTKLCASLVKALGEVTEDGFVFRIDLRLRPHGDDGAMVSSFDSMEGYYQVHGREWERYALIKARIIAGDKKEGENLLNTLKPFIYRKYLDYGTLESLREMKEKIEAEETKKGLRDDIKLGIGGIREIEFFGQIFQLIRGGVEPDLQCRGLCDVLTALTKRGHITEETRAELFDAYHFLRNAENRLQEFACAQTHVIPQEALQKTRLALSMGFASAEEFTAELQRRRENVLKHFNAILRRSSDSAPATDETAETGLRELLGETPDRDRCLAVLQNAGFKDPKPVLAAVERLKDDPATGHLSREGKKRLADLMPKILLKAVDTKHPDVTVERIFNILKTVQRRICYLSLLLENPAALDNLVNLAAKSSWIANFLARHPLLLDELIDPRTLYAVPEKEDMQRELDHRMAKFAPDDLENQMEEMRVFKQVNTLRVAAADIAGILPLMKVSDRLTYIAETVLERVLEICRTSLAQKHGEPGGGERESGFCVIAYGKLGGIELGYGSDVDLVFLHAAAKGETNGGDPIDNSMFFARLGLKIIHFLTTRTATGVLYDTDMRLRPSGESGILVSDMDAFADYQRKDAWTWEHQAIIRARPVAGSPELTERFLETRRETLMLRRSKSALAKEVASMRKKLRAEKLNPQKDLFDLKQGFGAMVDIEFLIQFLTLLHASRNMKLTGWTDNIRLMETLAATGILDDHTASFLKEAYISYRSAVHGLSLQGRKATVPDTHFADLRARVMKAWDYYLGEPTGFRG